MRVLPQCLVDFVDVEVTHHLPDFHVLLAGVDRELLDLAVLTHERGFVQVGVRVDQAEDAVDVVQVGGHRGARHDVDRHVVAEAVAHLGHRLRQDRLHTAQRVPLVEEQHIVAALLEQHLPGVLGHALPVDRPPVRGARCGAGLGRVALLVEVRRDPGRRLAAPQVVADLLQGVLVVVQAVGVVGQNQDVRPAAALPLRLLLGLLPGVAVQVVDQQVLLDTDEEVLQLLDELADQLRRHGETHLVAHRCHQDRVSLGGKSFAGPRVG
ncbi:hypothetical protein D3C86_1469440 [compost metagenome]